MTVIVEDTVIRFGRVIEVYKPRIFLFAPVIDFSKHFVLLLVLHLFTLRRKTLFYERECLERKFCISSCSRS